MFEYIYQDEYMAISSFAPHRVRDEEIRVRKFQGRTDEHIFDLDSLAIFAHFS